MEKIGIRNALCGLKSGLLGLAVGTLASTLTHAGIVSVSGQMTVISPPPSVVSGGFSNNQVYLFPERTSFALTNIVRVDISRSGVVSNLFLLSPTNLPANTWVDSTYLHHASPNGTNAAGGSVTFDADVLGIICISTNLATNHSQLGAPGTVYQTTAGTQGFELGPAFLLDNVVLSANRRSVTVSTSAGPFAQDDLRILTAAQPGVIGLPPVANAGTNQTVNEMDFVTLDGTGSYDPNTPPLPLTYAWTQSSGIAVTLTGANTATPSFTAPGVPAAGAVLAFQLVVANGTITRATNSVTINVGNNGNYPPTANAGSDQTVGENTLVALDASGSSDPDDDLFTMQWSQVSGPVVTLGGADTFHPTFTAPSITATQSPVNLKFQLVLNDGQVNSGAAFVSINVTNISSPPIANAGTNQSVHELDLVTLDGTASSDPEGNPLTYLWTQITGLPRVALQGTNNVTAIFTAPQLNVGGASFSRTLTFQLKVSNGTASSTSTVNVTVNNVNHAPIADAGPDQTVPSETLVTLNGTNSADIDHDPLTFAWVQTSGPSITLDNTHISNPTFITPMVGLSGQVLTFQLTVSDAFGGVASDEVTVNVTYVNHPPTVSAGTPQTVNEGDTAMLIGTASDADSNNLTLVWSQVSGPIVTIANTDSLTPSFVAPLVTRDETNVVLRLTADDGYGGITSDDVTIHIANINHAPVAQAPANMSVPEATPVSIIGQGTDLDTEEQNQLVYTWVQTGGPQVTLNGSGPNADFTAPMVTDGGDPNAKVTLTFMLTVTDPNGASGSNSIDVVVANVDHSPIAVAGGNLTVNEGSSVTLNGSASSDPDLDPLTYAWVQVSGPAVTLSDANSALPYFTAPFVNATGATLQFRLTVDDGFGGTNSTTTTVTVKNLNDPPIADYAQPSITTLWPPDHSMVNVSIVGIVDPNNNATITITGVTQDEATNSSSDGDTDVDAVINLDGTVLLRAERSSNGDGRVYHIHFIASDFEGSASGVVKVTVPHNKKNDAVIDGGELYDSTQ